MERLSFEMWQQLKNKSISKNTIHKSLTLVIALVWLINGLFCKVLDLVPRHREIIAAILGKEHADILTLLIGISEIVMAMWIVSGFKSRFNAALQIVIILTMNLLEFFLVPDLLLWGYGNLPFAVLLIGIVYYNEFVLNKKNSLPI